MITLLVMTKIIIHAPDHYLDQDNEISVQDLEQQLLLELRDPVGAMAVHRQLVEVEYQHDDDRGALKNEIWAVTFGLCTCDDFGIENTHVGRNFRKHPVFNAPIMVTMTMLVNL